MNEALKSLKKTVLIADDDGDLRDTLTHLLRRITPNFEVTGVADGDAALEMLKNRAFDLMILDLLMPKLDGRRIVEHMVGTDKINRPTHLLIVSGGITAGRRRIGRTTLLSKPFSLVDIEEYLLSIYGPGAEECTPETMEEKIAPQSAAILDELIEPLSTGLCVTVEKLCATKASPLTDQTSLKWQSAEQISVVSSFHSSEYNATLTLTADSSTLLTIMERMLGEPLPMLTPDALNAAAEINNQVIGYAKEKLRLKKREIYIGIHTVTVAQQLSNICVGNTRLSAFCYETDAGPLQLEISSKLTF